jgi:hypothetical protein
MGVLTDFVIAEIEDAKAVGKSLDPVKQFGGMYCKNTIPEDLCAINAVLTGDHRFKAFKLLYQRKPFDGAEVRQIPPAFVKRFAELDDTKLHETAQACLKTTEFRSHKLNELEQWLKELRNVCQKSLAQKKCLLLSMSP